ncbi:MmyB family transcriptional regulator [[Erwinia] mediterraneensis]|uniref:MmyB family transcriptional regulator n=1 Tax=[Erwinia] mediterraneensis TaxID=2161819 RepID=UPI001031E203
MDYLRAQVPGGELVSASPQEISPTVKRVVDDLAPHPTFVRTASMDIIYWNTAATEKIFDWSTLPVEQRNSLLLMFGYDGYQQRIENRGCAARHTVASFRTTFALSKSKARFSEILTALSASSAFQTLWQEMHVEKIGQGEKVIRNARGEQVNYRYVSLEVENSPGIFVICYLAM